MSHLPPTSPGDNDPLDERMRRSLRSEHQAVEARLQNRLAAGVPTSQHPRPGTVWLLPAGFALAVLAIAGVVFFTGNEAPPEQIDVAGQTDGEPAPREGTTVEPETVGDQIPTPVTPAPTAEPAPLLPVPAAEPSPTPVMTECLGVSSAQTYFIVGILPDDADGGLVAHTGPGVDTPVVGVFPPDAVVESIDCEMLGDTPWINVASPMLTGWVNSNWLARSLGACLFGEQYGSQFPEGERVDQIFGPVEGFAVGLSGPPWIAFAPLDATTYRWYDGGVAIGVPCYLQGPRGEVCLNGNIVLNDVMSPEPIFSDSGPLRGARTGRLWAPLERRGLVTESVEVTVSGRDGNVYTGFVDPNEVELAIGVCEGPIGPAPVANFPDTADHFSSLPCTLAGNTAPGATADYAGTANHGADHIHNLRVDSDGSCVRFIIELGSNGDDESGLALPAAFLPAVSVASTATETTVRFGEGMVENFEGPNEAIWGTHIAMRTSTTEVTIGHPVSAGSITFLENPARVVIDLETRPIGPGQISGAIVGSTFVLSNPIQSDLAGPGLPLGEPIQLTGYGTPFEAQGEWRIYPWPEGSPGPRPEALRTLYATEPLASGLVMTDGWFRWGSFDVTIDAPSVEGTYVIVVGDVSPPDGVFEAVGQLIRIDDPATPAAGPIEPWLLPQRD